MKLGELFKIGETIHQGESVSDFNINKIDNDTIKFDLMISNLNKKNLDCGIITKNPIYWKLTPKTRRKSIDKKYYISLMNFTEELKERDSPPCDNEPSELIVEEISY